MSTVVKENQILSAIPETATARPVASSTAAPSGEAPARPQPVALEVSVTVNGARTVAGSDKREPFSESTKTVLIFGHGAVVRLSSSVAPGQLLFLTNEKTKKEVVCQVVKSKNYHNVSGYVELEFTEPVAGFWGMRFPTERGTPQPSQHSPTPAATVSKSPISAPAIESRPVVSKELNASDLKSAVPDLSHASAPAQAPSDLAGLPVASSQQSLGSTAFTSASVTSSKPSTVPRPGNEKTSNVLEISRPKSSAAQESIQAAKTQSKSILDSDEVKIPSWLEPLARNAAAASAALPEIGAKEQLNRHEEILVVQDLAITETASVPETANHAVAAPSFGSRLLVDENDSLTTGATSRSNKKFLLWAVAAGLLLLIGAGAWYMRQTAGIGQTAATPTLNAPAETGNSAQTASPAQGAAPTQSSPSGTLTAVPAQNTAAAGTSLGTASGTSSGSLATNSPEPVNASLKSITKGANEVSTPATTRPKKPMLGEVNLSAPIVNSPAGGQVHTEEALNLEASSQVGPAEGLASGLSVSNSTQPAVPHVAVPIGGDVKPARLISSVAPTYPAFAKAQQVAGSVKIDALVDATGRVTSTKIVSGPPLLQQAAMDALRRWKYEPAQLNGNPVATHLTVTIQFKIQ